MAIAGVARQTRGVSTVALESVQVDTEPSSSVFVVGPATGEKLQIKAQDHIWSPATYAPLATAWLGGGDAAVPQLSLDDATADFNLRAALTDLRVETLLNENERVSGLLTRDIRSASAHESAALLVGALALRESPGMFADVRPALSRMAAHLAVADAIRGRTPGAPDGSVARVVLTVLVGRQRDALTMLEAFERRATTPADRTWVRALRLRITGDWRTSLSAEATLLERFEYARALKTRAGSDALLDFFDTFDLADVTDWQRIALSDAGSPFNVESGHRFTDGNVERELSEAGQVWSRLHARESTAFVLGALNDRPASSPVQSRDGKSVITVLDWGTWAAFHQRQLCHALTGTSRHYWNLGAKDSQKRMTASFQARFSSLTLYPVVLRWIATTSADYERSVADARKLVETSPQLVTVAAWNFLVDRPDYVQRAAAFPFVASWFPPAVPANTAFDLHARALLPGCPRPPSRAQARLWADAAPFDHWTVWSAEWLAVTGKPSVAAITRAFGPLVDYDYVALLKLLDYLEMKSNDQVTVAEKICRITPNRCDVLAQLLLREAREAEAVVAYERWIRASRDRVRVSTGLTWLVRRYEATGNRDRAEELARMAADVGSAGGFETLGNLLDARGEYSEAERAYREIADRYGDTTQLGTFFVRQGLRTRNRALELKGWDNLRAAFPTGMEPLALHALDVTPLDGMGFQTFGQRATAIGLRPTDVVVGVDGWRVRSHRQYAVLARLSHSDSITLTVWRDRRYQQLSTRMPERWLGVVLRDHHGAPTAH